MLVVLKLIVAQHEMVQLTFGATVSTVTIR
jgi:hypothetical protein